jgi:hypothetical protein
VRKICIFFVNSTDVMENLFHMIRLILFFRVTVPPKYGSSKLIPVREKSNSPTTSASTSTIFLDCRDCTNITKVTQYDFQKGDYSEGGVEYLFSFGEVAYDTVSDRVVVVVGHRKTKVYAVSGFSIIQNFCTDVAITPYSRSTRLLRTVASAANALNYRVVRECADMEQYVIHNSEKAYRL